MISLWVSGSSMYSRSKGRHGAAAKQRGELAAPQVPQKSPARSAAPASPPAQNSPGGRAGHSNPAARGPAGNGPQTFRRQIRPRPSGAPHRGTAGSHSQCGIRCPWHTGRQRAFAAFRCGGRMPPACPAQTFSSAFRRAGFSGSTVGKLRSRRG